MPSGWCNGRESVMLGLPGEIDAAYERLYVAGRSSIGQIVGESEGLSIWKKAAMSST
jgi:hypothetical protein